MVISNGGKAILHPNFYDWFPFMIDHKEKVLIGDEFLRKDIFKATVEKINKNRYKNIVIIGGSHSGFSAAHLLLNGPSTYKNNNSINLKKYKTFPDS